MRKLFIALILLIAFVILVVSIHAQIISDKQRNFRKDEPQREVELDGQNSSSDTSTSTQRSVIYETARVSWYGKETCGGNPTCKTASGEKFNESDLTFANRSMQFGTRVRFCAGNKCVVCRANDRGPNTFGRSFDLSRGCFGAITELEKGIVKVKWTEVYLK